MNMVDFDQSGFYSGLKHPCNAVQFSYDNVEQFSEGVRPGVFLAASEADLEAVARLRYVAFGDRKYSEADHIAGLLVENVDCVSLNLFTLGGGEVVSAMRLTRASDCRDDRQLFRLIDAHLIDSIRLDNTVVVSRFARDPKRCAVGSLVNLIRSTYLVGLLAGAEICLLETRQANIPIFARFGFVPTGITFDDTHAGCLHAMKLDLFDLYHLRSLRSPLCVIAEKYMRVRNKLEVVV